MLKKYKNGIILGVISILSNLIIVGIPIGGNIIEIINMIIFIIGLLFIIYLGLIKDKDKYLLLFSIIYLIVLVILAGIIEINHIGNNVAYIGFVIGLLLSIVGLVDSNRNKNRYNIKISIIINAVALIISILSLGMIYFGNDGVIMKKINNDCNVITGGGYNIFFDTNSDVVIDNMHVCIGCSPDSYSDLPIPERDGYNFLGWYYDGKLTDKVEVSNSINIKPVPDKDKHDCVIGYKDIVLYAKWKKN